jgi:hypothetical protein
MILALQYEDNNNSLLIWGAAPDFCHHPGIQYTLSVKVPLVFEILGPNKSKRFLKKGWYPVQEYPGTAHSLHYHYL